MISDRDFVSLPTDQLLQGPKLHIDEASESDKTIINNIKIQKYEVTQYQWFKVMNNNPSIFSLKNNCKNHTLINKVSLCPDHPVENISYKEVQEFISKLNSNDKNRHYRLPTEEEWEFAARLHKHHSNRLQQYANFSNELKQTNKVKEKKSINGLYNILGNIWEYTMTPYSRYKYTTENKLHPNDKEYIVIKGGGWNSKKDHLRRAYRGKTLKNMRSSDLGFRLVIE